MAFAIPTWSLWLLLSNIAIAFIEYTYRSGNYDTFLQALPYIIVPILIGQLGLFEGFRRADSLFLAAAIFSCINVSMRVVVCHFIGETLSIVNWVGVALLFCSAILIKIK